MNILFIDHECHQKTRSAEFFLAILQRTNNVRIVYYKKAYKVNILKDDKNWADIVVVWEFLISRCTLSCLGKPCVFVPMYDNEWESFWQWKRIAWSGMGVISFCDKVTEHARRCGVTNILDVRYFPDPDSLPKEKGDPKRVFLWERGEIGRAVAEKLFPSSDGYVFDVKGDNEFLEREAYLARVAKCGVVIAPRRKEGIGMSFLEAMAMGKCVVANDDATMNEYIKNGENGVLFSRGSLKPVGEDLIICVRANVPISAAKLRERWLRGSRTINDFVSNQQPCCPSFANRLKILLFHPFFLAEGALHVVFQKVKRCLKLRQ